MKFIELLLCLYAIYDLESAAGLREIGRKGRSKEATLLRADAGGVEKIREVNFVELRSLNLLTEAFRSLLAVLSGVRGRVDTVSKQTPNAKIIREAKRLN